MEIQYGPNVAKIIQENIEIILKYNSLIKKINRFQRKRSERKSRWRKMVDSPL